MSFFKRLFDMLFNRNKKSVETKRMVTPEPSPKSFDELIEEEHQKYLAEKEIENKRILEQLDCEHLINLDLEEDYTSIFYKNVEITEENAQKEYLKFLHLIAKVIKLTDDVSFTIEKDQGLSTYYFDEEDLKVTMKLHDELFIARSFDDFKYEISSGRASYNFKILIQVFNKYFQAKNTGQVCFINLDDENQFEIIIIEQVLEEEVNTSLDIPIAEFFDPDEVDNYKQKGLFRYLDEKTVERGIQLSKEYLYPSRYGFMWSFKDLVVAITPRESNGYESEVNKLFEATHNHFNWSDIQVVHSDERYHIDFKIEGEQYSIKNLPEFVSFRLVDGLNKILSEKFQTSFYLWNWEDNPWEQQVFVYMHHDTANRLLYELCNELTGEVIDFYDSSMR